MIISAVARPCRYTRAVKFVLDLNEGAAQLSILAVNFHAQGFVGRKRLRHGVTHGICVLREAVVGDVQICLGIALVAKPAHPQRRGVRQVQRSLVEALERVGGVFDERLAQCR